MTSSTPTAMWTVRQSCGPIVERNLTGTPLPIDEGPARLDVDDGAPDHRRREWPSFPGRTPVDDLGQELLDRVVRVHPRGAAAPSLQVLDQVLLLCLGALCHGRSLWRRPRRRVRRGGRREHAVRVGQVVRIGWLRVVVEVDPGDVAGGVRRVVSRMRAHARGPGELFVEPEGVTVLVTREVPAAGRRGAVRVRLVVPHLRLLAGVRGIRGQGDAVRHADDEATAAVPELATPGRGRVPAEEHHADGGQRCKCRSLSRSVWSMVFVLAQADAWAMSELEPSCTSTHARRCPWSC